jgi:hypothetical protein
MSLTRIREVLGLANASINTAPCELDDKSFIAERNKQKTLILEQLQTKQSDAELALDHLMSEYKAINSLNPELMNHIRAYSSIARSKGVLESELQANSSLFNGYKNFHTYVENALQYKTTIDNYLKTKPAFSELHEGFDKLQKTYQNALKKMNHLATYESYDKKLVSKVLENCRQAESPRPSR